MNRCVLFAACVAATLAVGCSSDPTQGYSFRSTRAADIRTISIPVFDNQSFNHGVETQLTEAITKEVQRMTNWVVVTRNAQTTLTGSITSSRLRPLSTSSSTGLVLEQAVELNVDFEWRDARTGEVLVSRRGLKAMESFVPARGTDERIDLGTHAAIQELARTIVNELRTNW